MLILKRVISAVDNILNLLLGKDLPEHRPTIVKSSHIALESYLNRER